jgi:hypothetical protein
MYPSVDEDFQIGTDADTNTETFGTSKSRDLTGWLARSPSAMVRDRGSIPNIDLGVLVAFATLVYGTNGPNE